MIVIVVMTLLVIPPAPVFALRRCELYKDCGSGNGGGGGGDGGGGDSLYRKQGKGGSGSNLWGLQKLLTVFDGVNQRGGSQDSSQNNSGDTRYLSKSPNNGGGDDQSAEENQCIDQVFANTVKDYDRSFSCYRAEVKAVVECCGGLPYGDEWRACSKKVQEKARGCSKPKPVSDGGSRGGGGGTVGVDQSKPESKPMPPPAPPEQPPPKSPPVIKKDCDFSSIMATAREWCQLYSPKSRAFWDCWLPFNKLMSECMQLTYGRYSKQPRPPAKPSRPVPRDPQAEEDKAQAYYGSVVSKIEPAIRQAYLEQPLRPEVQNGSVPRCAKAKDDLKECINKKGFEKESWADALKRCDKQLQIMENKCREAGIIGRIKDWRNWQDW